MRFRKRLISFLTVISLLLCFTIPVTAAETDGEQDDIIGKVEYRSAVNSDILTDGFYYSDKWLLDGDPYTENDMLALTSMQLATTATTGDPEGLSAAFLGSMGFDSIGFSGFDEDSLGCKYTWGTKKVRHGEETVTIVAVAVNGYGSDSAGRQLGWMKNFEVNGEEISDEHYGFSMAAEADYEAIAGLGGSEPVKFWITGHSRGGAIAALIAQKLNTKAGIPASDIYAYTFEAPAQVEASAVPDNAVSYGFIHNYVSDNDIVTMVPMWDMVRYGVDHQLKTAETDAGLTDELTDVNSAAANKDATSQVPAEFVRNIVEVLQSGVKSREEYSSLHEDILVNSAGEEVTVSYVYQDIFTRLMETAFGDTPLGIPADQLLDRIDQLEPTIAAIVEAMRTGDDSGYLKAAERLREFMSAAGVELSFTDVELYALLKIAAPLIVDPNAGEEVNDSTYPDFMMPLLEFVSVSDMFVFSHYNDVVIARLKVLAPLPIEDDDPTTEETTKEQTTEEETTEVITTEVTTEITTEITTRATTTEITTEAGPAQVDNNAGNKSGNERVMTGDDTDPGIFLRLMILSMVGMGALSMTLLIPSAIKEKKRKK